MRTYAKIVNDDTKLVVVGGGSDIEYYKSIGFSEMEVEKAWNGSYYLQGYAPQKPLEAYKKEKLDQLQSIKNQKLKEFSYQDKVYQIDDSSKTNMNGKISAILLSQNSEAPIQSVSWIAKDNTITQFSTAEFLVFSQAVASYIESVLFKNDGLRTRVNSASSIDEIKAIEWIE
ncbi:DUF4376 domain-containing protein [Campylobacter lanienae]|uniref:DUF4376 domain-containing protein n=1 Tax=Campylobacter lanienae TaxID=75658 RepID=UPI000BB400B9|nr:DUF4376 domain-containing protein [Campylobacter lanienae]